VLAIVDFIQPKSGLNDLPPFLLNEIAVKIALIQQPATTDKSANLKRGLENALKAIEAGAKVIGFAELAFEPFYPQVPATDGFVDLAAPIPGPVTDAFCELAKKHEVVFVLNQYEIANGKTYDSSPVIDADGSILGTTRMVHITDYPCFHEQGYYAEGDQGITVYDTRFGKLGVAICYDRHYPEYMRALGVGGAEIVFVPQAGAVDEWPEGLYEAELRVAAFQNGYFTALVNRVGAESELTFAGESFVCDCSGNVIARAGQGTEEVLLCDVDTSQIANSNAKRLFFRDRRPELYPDWI